MTQATRPVRPDAFIAGFPKAATTWLHAVLAEHPEVCASRPKETDYFTWWAEGRPDAVRVRAPSSEAEYGRAFVHGTPGQVLVDGTVSLLEVHEAVSLVREHCGVDTKLIVLYREPVDRLWAHLCYAWGGKVIPSVPTRFQDVLVDHPERVRRGRYVEHVRPWRDAGFPMVHVFDFELKRDPVRVVDRVTDFLGVEPTRSPTVGKRVNVARRRNNWHRWLNESVGPGLKRNAAGRTLLRGMKALRIHKVIDELGLHRRRNPTAPPAWRQEAWSYYRESVDHLEELLEVDLSAWRAAHADPDDESEQEKA